MSYFMKILLLYNELFSTDRKNTDTQTYREELIVTLRGIRKGPYKRH